MSNIFTSDLKRGILRIARKGRQYGLSKVKKSVLEDGGTVTFCNSPWLDRKAHARIKKFTRKEAFRIRSNIEKKPMLAPVSQAKDAVIEELLQTGGYTFSNLLLIRNPFGEAPLTALALFVTSEPCAVRVTVEGKSEKTDITALLPETTHHRVPIIGLYAGKINIVHIELIQNGKVKAEKRIPLKTIKLPDDLKNVIKAGKVSENPAFENILVAGGIDIKTCAFDRNGKIRYYLRRKPKGYGIFPLSSGRFLFMEQDISAPSYTNPQSVQSYDMDYLGRVRKVYFSRNGIHHTIEEKTPGGNIMAAGSSMEGHSEDLILEIDRENGQIVQKIKVGDVFDETYQDMMDWAHINSASYYEKDNEVLVSMRNIHSIASFDWEKGTMRWLLADPRFWAGTPMEDKLLRPLGDVPFFYQQHAVFELTDVDFDGNPDTKHIIVFDNHWHKRRKVEFFDKDKKTYISFYTINEKEGTVSFHKRFPCPKSKIRSNAILCHDKNRLYAMAGSLVKPLKNSIGVIREYDFETEEVLSEFFVQPGFFRAHEFEPETASLTEALPITKDYVAGNLKHAELLPDGEAEKQMFYQAEKTDNEKLSYVLREDVLYIHETDHLIQKVYFVGKKQVYFVDYADTYQTMKTFENAEYYIPMWLDTLPDDKYTLYLEINGRIQNTRKYIRKG
jgi:hypothetical protein